VEGEKVIGTVLVEIVTSVGDVNAFDAKRRNLKAMHHPQLETTEAVRPMEKMVISN